MNPLLLALGESYQGMDDYNLNVYLYNLFHLRWDCELAMPFKWSRFVRVYPSLIGSMGRPGFGFLMARRISEIRVVFWYGYIGYDGYPVLASVVYGNYPWFGHFVGLDEKHVNWLWSKIDRRTLVTAKRIQVENLDRAKIDIDRREALRASERASEEYRQRIYNTPKEIAKRERRRIYERRKRQQQKAAGDARRAIREREQEAKRAIERKEMNRQEILINLRFIAKMFAQAALQEKAPSIVREGFEGDLNQVLSL